MAKRILFLTYYYAPDNSPGAFRAKALNDALLQSDAVEHVDVLTTVPNRYSGAGTDVKLLEQGDKYRLERITIPRIGFGYLGEAVAFLYFAIQVLRRVRGQEYDVVLATSSRLMTSLLATWVVRKRNCCLYLDIRDLFVVNLRLLFPVVLAKPLQWLFGRLELWSMRRADKVSLVSAGFIPYFTSHYPNKAFSIFTNGVDELFTETFQKHSEQKSSKSVSVLYAGNIGKGQGLEKTIPELATRLDGTHEFTLIGAGGQRTVLRESLKRLGVKNVRLLPPVPRAELVEHYQRADILFLHLNDYSGFECVLPSKLFEYAATGKPILAGVTGYTESFIEQYLDDVAVFHPGDVEAATEAIKKLKLDIAPRTNFITEFSRGDICRRLVEEMLEG